MVKLKIIPVILCGGKGSRLWPISRESYPKQFIALSGDNKKSLLQTTLDRISKIKNIQPPILICNQEHRFLVAEQLRESNIKPDSIILEPIGKNTAPAIAIAALKSLEDNKNSILLVLSADHKIDDQVNFVQVIESGLDYVNKKKIVTFGVIPDSPNTNYGYIECDRSFQNKENGFSIIKFIEKPNIELANELFKNKKYLWNSGIFAFEANVIIDEFRKFEPLILDVCKEAMKGKIQDLDFLRLSEDSFSKCPNISIDNAIMEKTNLGVVLPLKTNWSDIGSWKSLYESEKKDVNGLVTVGKIFHKNSKNSYIRSSEKLIVSIGIKDLVVVETDDAILVSSLEEAKNVKSVVELLEIEGYKEAKKHRKVHRPWGHFFTIIEDKEWQVKRIEVNPGCKLSLQMHNYRSEHWVVVSGTAEVQINETIYLLSPNQSAYVPLGAKHRLGNSGKDPLVIIEIQTGSYLGEDDIIRFQDHYGRANDH